MTTFCRITEELEPRPEKRPGLNLAAYRVCEQLAKDAEILRIEFHDDGLMIPTLDCGVNAPGSLEAGLRVARICLADRAHVQLSNWSYDPRLPAIMVRTDEPLEACLASQYAGWRISGDGFFAMGSGPMRAAAAVEPLFQEYKLSESTEVAVGILESREFPPPEVAEQIAHACDIIPRRLTLLVAPTSSLVGTMQIVARSVETALHKLHELKFDLRRVISGFGTAPLPPSGGKDLPAMGKTNDAILYGGEVTLWVSGEDDDLQQVAQQLPSSASSDFGAPFLELFERYDHDFYKMDPLLFSPASISLVNLNTGKTHQAGRVLPDLVQKSFGS
jgi:methenyltetrahydromethanopterin cyclohydrolase